MIPGDLVTNLKILTLWSDPSDHHEHLSATRFEDARLLSSGFCSLCFDHDLVMVFLGHQPKPSGESWLAFYHPTLGPIRAHPSLMLDSFEVVSRFDVRQD